jgi:TonB family protein
MINDFFAHFLAQRPRGRIDTRTIHTGCNMAVDMGTYTFSLMDDKGTTSEVAARYTFVYEYRDGAWKILHQHSSAMPGAGANADARVAREDDADASTPAKPPKAEPSTSKPRKERRSKRKDDLDDVPVAAKPAEKPAAGAVADTKTAADVKPSADAKAVADANARADAKAPDPKSPAVAKAATPAKPAPAAATPTDTKPAPEVRTAMFANLTSSPSPSKFYPPEAMRRKERGSVNLKVCADSTGVVAENVEVLRSSGSKLLDDAATSWARAVTWVPATYNRQRVEGCSTVDVAFEPPAELASARR